MTFFIIYSVITIIRSEKFITCTDIIKFVCKQATEIEKEEKKCFATNLYNEYLYIQMDNVSNKYVEQLFEVISEIFITYLKYKSSAFYFFGHKNSNEIYIEFSKSLFYLIRSMCSIYSDVSSSNAYNDQFLHFPDQEFNINFKDFTKDFFIKKLIDGTSVIIIDNCSRTRADFTLLYEIASCMKYREPFYNNKTYFLFAFKFDNKKEKFKWLNECSEFNNMSDSRDVSKVIGLIRSTDVANLLKVDCIETINKYAKNYCNIFNLNEYSLIYKRICKTEKEYIHTSQLKHEFMIFSSISFQITNITHLCTQVSNMVGLSAKKYRINFVARFLEYQLFLIEYVIIDKNTSTKDKIEKTKFFVSIYVSYQKKIYHHGRYYIIQERNKKPSFSSGKQIYHNEKFIVMDGKDVFNNFVCGLVYSFLKKYIDRYDFLFGTRHFFDYVFFTVCDDYLTKTLMIKDSADFFSIKYIDNFIQRILKAYTINSISTYNAMFETKQLIEICSKKENIFRSIRIINEIFLATITNEEFDNIKVLLIVIQVKKSKSHQNYFLIFPKQQQKVLKQMMNLFRTFINFAQELPDSGFLNQKYGEIKMYFYNVIDLIIFNQTPENIYNLEKKNSLSYIFNLNLLHYSMIQLDEKYGIYNQYLNKLYHKNLNKTGHKKKYDCKEIEKRYDLLKKNYIFRLHTAKLQQLLSLFRDKYFIDKKHHLLDNVALVFIGSGNKYVENNLVNELSELLDKNCE